MRIDRVHTALCGTKFTRGRWFQVATPPHSYHGALVRSLLQPAIILLLELSRYVEARSILTVGMWHERACHALFGLTCNAQLCDPDQSGLGECAFSVDALKPDSIRFNVHWVSSVDRPLDIKQTTKGPGCSHLSHTLCLLYYFLQAHTSLHICTLLPSDQTLLTNVILFISWQYGNYQLW